MLFVIDGDHVIYMGEDDAEALALFHTRRDAYKKPYRGYVKIYRGVEVTSWA